MRSTLLRTPPDHLGRWIAGAVATAALVAAAVSISVWWWLAMAAVAGLVWGAALAWSARHDPARLEARFRHERAP